jgi:hypothetical protein
MIATQLACPACGAELHVADNAVKARCEYCGKESALEYSHGQATVIAADRVGQAIASSNAQVSDTIRNTSDVTQIELKRLQMTQDLSSSQMMLANVRTEIRSLERDTHNKVAKRQLKDLRSQETELKERIATLQTGLAAAGASAAGATPPKTKAAEITWKTGLGWTLLVWFLIMSMLAAVDPTVAVVGSIVAAVAFNLWYRARRRKQLAKNS